MPVDPIQLVLTQDADGAATWRDALAASGIACWHWPAFEIHALSDQAVLDRFLDGLSPRPGDPAASLAVCSEGSARSPEETCVGSSRMRTAGSSTGDGARAVVGSGAAGTGVASAALVKAAGVEAESVPRAGA